MNYEQMGIAEKRNILISSTDYVPYEESPFKINADFLKRNAYEESYRELMVSYIPMLPLLEKPVAIEEADYILYMHCYARIKDMSDKVISDLQHINEIRKDGAEIIEVGKAANVEGLLNGSITNITFLMDHFTEKLGKRFGIDICEQYFVYDDVQDWLSIWPVDGCLRKCGFCRRSYMHIPFESLSLELIKEKLDYFKENFPEKMRHISLRAENLTEYGIDIYGTPQLPKLLYLINSYDEVEAIDLPIGNVISEINKEILDAYCHCKISHIALNFEAGDDELLRIIGKNHTCQNVIDIYSALRQAHPNIEIVATIMIGLPCEGLKDIYALANLIYIIKPDVILCNYYGMAPKQPLAKLPQLSKSLKAYHLKLLINLLHKMEQKTICSHKTVTIDVPLVPKKISRKYIRACERLKKQQETLDNGIDFSAIYHFKL